MKYRIKIYNYENGRQEFSPQVLIKRFKIFDVWKGINMDGEEYPFDIEAKLDYRNSALKAIDNHLNGNSKIKEITFEYINK